MSAPRTRASTPYPDPVESRTVGAALFDDPARSLPPEYPEMVAPAPRVVGPTDVVDYSAIRDSSDFEELRARMLRFVVPVTALFMANFMVFVLLSAYAPDLMATPAIGLINVGLLVGVFQFVSTVTIVVVYGRFARARLDPLAEHIRDRAEGP